MSEKDSVSILQVDKLQAQQNNGRGVSCIQTVVLFLRRGDTRSAVATCISENDKIRSYPGLQQLLRQALPEYDQHLTRMEKMWEKISR